MRTLRLSDAFLDAPGAAGGLRGGLGGLLELEVSVVNVNAGSNSAIVRRSGSLSGYAAFIGKVREFQGQGEPLGEAIKKASAYCMMHGILKDELSSLSTEVINMLTAEFNMEAAQRVWFEEGREEGMTKGIMKGREEGMTKGREEGMTKGREEKTRAFVSRMLGKGFPVEEIADLADLPLAQVVSMRDKLRH